MNVLIVDDQPEVVESMVTGVNWEKIPVEQVFTAYSVKEAQSVFERERIDVLLLSSTCATLKCRRRTALPCCAGRRSGFPAWCVFSFLRTQNLNTHRRP